VKVTTAPYWADNRKRKLADRARRRAQARRAEDGGFAILEVVIAFTILIMMLVPLANLYSEVIRVAADARNRVEGANLAAQQMG
jgi:Tfp pilus assembly protein PilV